MNVVSMSSVEDVLTEIVGNRFEILRRNEVKCMYDVEMMQMLNLIHAENQYIFEILRAGLLSNDVKDAVTFDNYDKEYKRIIKSLERYSYCSDCSYKNRFEKMKDIIKEKDEKSE